MFIIKAMVPLSLNFRGFHKNKSLKFEIRTPVITLQAGQRETIVGNIRPDAAYMVRQAPYL